MPIVSNNNKLKLYSVTKNVTLHEMARRCGTSQTMMSFYANGHYNIPYKYIPILSEVLNIPKKQLLEELNVVKE